MPKGAVKGWVERLQAQKFKVVGPKALHGQFVFDEIESYTELVLDYPTTVLPPKKYLLPPREVLFSFNAKTMEMQAEIEVEPTVILGVHTCDLHAIALLDKVNNTGYADQHYKARSEATYIVSIECLKPCMEHSFCKSMGTLTVPEKFDLHMTDLGEVWALDIGSEKGERLLEGFSQVWDPADADYDKLNEVIAAKWPNFQYRLDFDVTELPNVLAAGAKSSVWDELGERCLACGMCTKVCPTCYCFDVTDEVDLALENGQRVRTWDSCQIDKFAVVAGGHDFRSKRALRQRHRFMRKGKYQYEAFGLMGCVGCGRCALSCLVDITPVDTFNALYRQQQPVANGD
jgi:ferredoxin